MARKDTIRFEIWRGKRVITVRDADGKLLSRKEQKGSGIKTKDQAYNQYKKTNNLDPNTVTLSRRNQSFKDGNVTKVNIKGQKTKTVKVKDLRQVKQIGKNTAILQTKEKIKNQKHYQYKVLVEWGENKQTTEGFSDIRGTEKQGFNRAKAGAIQLGIISYDYDIQFTDKNSGFAVSPSRRTRVYFKVKSEVQTYVNTVKSFN